MDSTVLPGAVAPSSAAPIAPVAESVAPVVPVGSPAVAAPVAAVPVQGSPPDSPATPVTSAPVDVQTLQEQARLYQQIAPEYQKQQQAIEQFRQAMAVAAQQQREQEAETAARSRIETAYDFAKNLSAEDALAYVRRAEDQERAGLRQEIARIRQESQTQTQSMIERLTAPLYAQHLAKEHGLPAAYAERLAMLGDGRQMDAYVPVLKAEVANQQSLEQKLQTALSQIDQLTRGQQAAALAANGAHVPSGVGVQPVAAGGQPVEPGSDAHLLSMPGVAEFLGFRVS